MKIGALDIVANVGDVWQPCDFTLKTNIAKERQTAKLLTYGEARRLNNDRC